jgi:hypothetical protein
MYLIPLEHQLKCVNCGQILDMRDLSQVFAHEDCNGIPLDLSNIKDIPFSGSKKIGTQEYFTKNKVLINLN